MPYGTQIDVVIREASPFIGLLIAMIELSRVPTKSSTDLRLTLIDCLKKELLLWEQLLRCFLSAPENQAKSIMTLFLIVTR